ncbi:MULTISPECIES: hypothetical protein [Marinomonas]|uniref:hypothetical protein n=1 Tax=Marinomonas TaxID=28253 RepID=UPI0010548BBF|nr:hypothetical protein [Marinomonas flavescens]
MNTFTKSALTVLAAASISSVALAAPGDATYGDIYRAQTNIHDLTSQIESLGHNVNTSADVNAAIAPSAKAAALNAKVSDLRLQLSALQTQRSE